MGRGPGYRRRSVFAVLALAFACAVLGFPAASVAATAPHVADSITPDTCALCHRGHTAPGSFGRVAVDSWEMTSSALALATPSNTGDTQLCYVCHGFEALGSGTDVQTSFAATSAHSLAPSSTAYGPSVKYCSSCHDSHGTDEITPGVSYPKLLRSRTSTGTQFFQAEEYCATCHLNRPLDTFDGLAIYRQTGHYSRLPDPVNGTKIRCSICHVAHGSAIAPLVVSEIASPALTATFTVPANDRRLCAGCHPTAFGTYPGQAAYGVSGHAVSAAVTTVTGEWPAADAKRLVGECQVCHAPMGRDNGSGVAIPKLVDAAGRALCDRCHDADGPASTNNAALAYPAAAATNVELLAAISPTATTAAHGRLAVYGTEATSTAPRTIVGPREYRAAGLVGDMAVGDIDGDDETETIVARVDAASLTVFRPDSLKGLTTFGTGAGAMAIAATAEYIAVADVIDDVTTLPEILVLDADAGNLYVYRWSTAMSAPTLIDGPIAVGTTPTGLAVGNLIGTPFAEVIVTNSATPDFRILRDDGADGLAVTDTIATDVKAGPRGPSIGDVWDEPGIEIAVANSGETSDTVSVFAADGALLGHLKIDAGAQARAWDTLVSDILPASAGAELSVAVYGADGMSTVNVFEQFAGGLDTPQRYDTGVGYGTGSLASGDIDGDGRTELIAGNGGWWDRDSTKAQAPSLQVFNHDFGGATLAGTLSFWSGGVELAGTAPALAVADVGGVGPSRHPVGAVAGAHNSTETPSFARHVECVDCHDPHEATSTVGIAPLVYGRLKGVFGVTVTNTGSGTSITYGNAQPVVREYEACLKCHSGYSTLDGGRNIASEVNTRNASVHAVEEASATVAQNGSFVAGWDNDSVAYCIDCHGSADSSVGAVKGPHTSTAAPILSRPYLGTLPGDTNLLCYKCHKRSVYYTSVDDTTTGSTGSWFFNSAGTVPELHGLHVRIHGFGCASCHVSHGSATDPRLMRGDVGFVLDDAPADGSCTNACHTGGAEHAYTR
jgi:predicted CXXCH cytochrome family protein